MNRFLFFFFYLFIIIFSVFSLSTFLLARLSFIYMTLFTMWTEKTSIKGEIRRVLPLSEVVKWGDEPPSAWCPGREKLGYQRFFPACTASPTCTRVHCLRAKVGPFLEGGRVEKGHLYALCYLFKNNHQKNGAQHVARWRHCTAAAYEGY